LWFKRNQRYRQTARPALLSQLCQHRLMPEMNAIETSYGRRTPSVLRVQIV
jgi:hypothetical protein